MKKRIGLPLTGVFLVVGLLVGFASEAVSTPQGENAKITVLNPLGKPPPIRQIPMARRLDTLDGKTVYFVDVLFRGPTGGGGSLLREMMDWFAKNMPKVKMAFKEKAGSYFDDDPKLWAEIKEKGDAMVMAIGH
jgi:hypothetical protein